MRPHLLKLKLWTATQREVAISFISKSITQDMAYLMKHTENTASAALAGSTTRSGRPSTFGKSAGMRVWHPWPASPDGPTATSIRTQMRSRS